MNSQKHVMVLHGVYFSRLEKKIEKQDIPEIVQENKYDKIPTFYSRETWPTKTNIKCWVCDRVPKESPYFAATKYIKDPTGNFCSAPCVASYIEDKTDRLHRWEMQQQLIELYYQRHGVKPKYIRPSPNKINRLEYGGIMTDDEYENQIKNCVQFY